MNVSQPVTQIGGTSFIGNGLSSTSVQVLIEVTPVPSISVSGSVTASSLGGASAVALGELVYYFVVSGPTGTVPVNIKGSASGSGDSLQAILQVSNTNNLPNSEVVTKSFVNGETSWTLNSPFNLNANDIYRVYMEAQGTAGAGAAGQSDSFSTIVDPTFLIDPSFDNAAYSLQFSPGIGDGIAGVPGPHRRCWPSWTDLGERRSSRLVATATENRLMLTQQNLAFFAPAAFSQNLNI